MKNKKIEEVINASITASFKDGNMQVSIEGGGFGIMLIIAEIEEKIMKEANVTYDELTKAKKKAIETHKAARKIAGYKDE